MSECKCGCGETVGPRRVFVNREHQTRWQSAQRAGISTAVAQQSEPDPSLTPAANANAATLTIRAILFHVQRALSWNLSEAVVQSEENARLTDVGTAVPIAQRYLVWRRSAMLVALPLLTLTTLIRLPSIFDRWNAPVGNLSDLGVLIILTSDLALLSLPVLIAISLKSWTDAHKSQRLLAAAWLAGTVVPIVIAFVPPSWILNLSGFMLIDGEYRLLSPEERRSVLFVFGVASSISYQVSLVPTIVSIPAGVMRGSLRVKGLIPLSVIPGWFIVVMAPFYSLLSIMVFVVAVQLGGNLLLVLGIALLALAPLLTIKHISHYVRPLASPDDKKGLAIASREGLLASAAGGALVILWALTATVPYSDASGQVLDGHLIGVGSAAYLHPWDLVQIVAEFAGRALLTAIVFAHIFLEVTCRNWYDARAFLGTPAEQEIDETISALNSFREWT